jgi:hypothetical protein
MDNVTYAQLTLPSPRSFGRHGRQNFSSSSSSPTPTPDRVIYSQIDPHLTSAHHQNNLGRYHPARIILNPQEKMSPTRGSNPYPGPMRHVSEEESPSWAPLLSAHQQESTL